MTTQERFVQFMDDKNLSSNSIAHKCNVATSTINEYYRGKTKDPRLSVIERVCIAYDISPIWLLYGEGPESLQTAKSRAYISEKNLMGASVQDANINIAGTQTNNADQSKTIELLTKQLLQLQEQNEKMQSTISTQAETISKLSATIVSYIQK